MSRVLTESSHAAAKVHLRLSFLPKKSKINVLDLFSADGGLWEAVKKKTPIKINTLRIEKLPGKSGIYLQGNNLQFMESLDLSTFDVIDIDAFGVPTQHLQILFDRKYKGRVFVTFTNPFIGVLPLKFLMDLGYSRAMLSKTKAIFCRDHMKKMEGWLAIKGGIRQVQEINIGNKHYFYFQM